jgi:hypothetical protein
MVEVGPKKRSIALPVLPILLAAALFGFLALAGTAHADPEGARIKSFLAERTTNQAGGHPDVFIDFDVGTRSDPFIAESCFCNTIKNALVEFPAGFSGNPHAVPQCSAAQFTLDECPVDSQMAIAKPSVLLLDGCCLVQNWRPVYNLAPEPGQAGLTAFKAEVINFPVYTVVSGRTGSDYGLNAEVKGIPQYLPLKAFKEELWGVPANPSHDPMRMKHIGPGLDIGGQKSNSPERPFFSNPTSCVGPIDVNFVTTAYDRGVHSAPYGWAPTSGCDQLNFNPSQSALPTTEAADSASGLDIDLKVPQNESPDTPTDSQIKRAEVRFPEGLSINSSAAEGKTSCSDAQARFGTENEAQCPEFAKIGTVSIDSSALPSPIPGAIYLGDPLPGDRYRVIVSADGYGTHVRFKGSTRLDPRTGALTAVFDNLPQAPLTEFGIHFFGSERGLFATPKKCGTYKVESEFEAWAGGPNQNSIQFFQITSGPGGSPCVSDPAPFDPGFRSVGGSNGAGAHSPISVRITRKDGDQTLSTIEVNTPPGFTATLKGVGRCSEQTLRQLESPTWTGKEELANPKCPSGSRIGESWAGAGAGSKPYYVPGGVYLTGPYKGAPLSFTVVTPVVGGPYDLGNVVNRIAVDVDPLTAAVTAESDPLPQIVDGIPLRVRSVLINLDRKDFTLNPTSCDPFQITGVLTGDQGARAERRNSFQVANCDSLDFEPKLRAFVNGAFKRRGHPTLTVTVTQDPSGQANLARAVVTLPHSAFLDQSHIRTICTRVQFAADACPARAVYGRATAITPLLDEPLTGPVYLRSSSNLLPDLVADLRGPASLPVQVVLVGKVDSPDQQLRTTFSSIPDTPVSKFTLRMQGGEKGLLINSADLCRHPQRVDVKIAGQNGARANQRPPLAASCGKARKKAGTKRAKAERTAGEARGAGR